MQIRHFRIYHEFQQRTRQDDKHEITINHGIPNLLSFVLREKREREKKEIEYT